MAQNGVEACSSNIALVRELIGAGPSCGTITAEEYPPIYLRGQIEPTANVIMLIPDGAGLTHRTLARIVYGGANSRLPSEKMWEVGIADTPQR